MELSWTTFFLEIINFLVLVWILKRFLYKPVLAIIARRRQGIEQQMHDARELNDSAQQLHQDYEHRLADWEQERQRARDDLARELEAERVKQLQGLQEQLQQEREKAEVAQSRQQRQLQRQLEFRALQQAGQFATRLLTQACGSELEARLVSLFISMLSELDETQRNSLNGRWGEQDATISVSSAYPLAQEQRQSLQQALARIGITTPEIAYQQDTELLAGLRIVIGARVLNLNIQHELAGFAEFSHDSR